MKRPSVQEGVFHAHCFPSLLVLVLVLSNHPNKDEYEYEMTGYRFRRRGVLV